MFVPEFPWFVLPVGGTFERETYMIRTIACVAALAAAAGSASANVTVNFTNQTWTGFNFSDIFAPGALTGTLTGAEINITLVASTNETYADDLCIYLDTLPLSTGGALQIGGFSNLGAAQRYSWPNGGSDVPGTTSIGSVALTTPINMTGSTLTVWLGNGYGAAGTSGTFTGSITLVGVDAVPAPGAAALLGLGGLVATRRRRA